MVERASYCGRNRAGPRADFHDLPVRVVAHDYPGRVARHPLRRSRGNVGAAIEDGLTRRLGITQHRGVDVDDDLVTLARSAGIEGVVERGLGEERQRVSLLLL